MRRASVRTLLLSGLSCLALAMPAVGQNWVVEHVDSSRSNWLMQDCTILALGDAGTHILYAYGDPSRPGRTLRHASRTDSAWRVSTIDSTGILWPVPSKLRADNAQRPCFAYSRVSGPQYDTWQLRVACYDDSVRTIVRVDSGRFVNAVGSPKPSYRILTSGAGAVAYTSVMNDSTYEVRFACQDGDTWLKETIWSRTQTGRLYVRTPVLVIGSGDQPMVWFCEYCPAPIDTGYLFLATRDNGVWRIDTADRRYMNLLSPVAAEIDAQGQLHFVCAGGYGLFWVGRPAAGALQGDTLEIVRAPFRGDADLALAGTTPHVVSSGPMNPLLNSFRQSPGYWVHEEIPSAGVGLSPSIAQDPNGWLVACFADEMGPPARLAYARRTVGPGVGSRGHAPRPGIVLSARPNPFRTAVSLQFTAGGLVELTVYDAAGRCISSFPVLSVERKASSVIWDGRDEQGRMLSPGVYYCQMRADGFTATQKLVVQR